MTTEDFIERLHIKMRCLGYTTSLKNHAPGTYLEVWNYGKRTDSLIISPSKSLISQVDYFHVRTGTSVSSVHSLDDLSTKLKAFLL